MKLILLLLLLAPGLAFGQATHGFTLTWTDPVERADGVALDPATELQSYRMRCEGNENVERIVERGLTDDLGDNQRQFEWNGAVSTGGWYTCMIAVTDTDALESDWSNAVEVRRVARPNPPNMRHLR